MEAIKILVGGSALRNLGSDRYTNDTDYLVNNKSSKEAFICDEKENVDSTELTEYADDLPF